MQFTRKGEGRPVIFLHGWCLSRLMWLYAEEEFGGECEVFLPDLPGFGRSAALAGPYSLARYAAEVRTLIDEFSLDGAVIVGFAFGAAVAMTLAADDDRGIAGIVAVGAPGAGFSPYDRMPRAMRRDWPDFARKSANALFHKPQSDATIGWLERIFASAALPVAIETVGVLSRFTPQALAGAIKVPQLFIHASQDGVAPVSIGNECLAGAARARLDVIDDCGHLIVLDRKDAFHDVLRPFLADPAARVGMPPAER